MEDINKKKIDEAWKDKAKEDLQPAEGSKESPEEHTHALPEADFRIFLTSLGMQTWIALGALPNPMTQKSEENLPQAKFIIDTLSVLQEKTKGNLNQEEDKMLEGLLYELRLSFIEKTKENPEQKK